MATTFADFTGDGNATKAFSFPSIKEADIKVEVDGTVYENRGITGASSGTTTFTITSYTTTGGGNVVFDSAPSNPAAIRIYRDTDVDSPKATFTAGSSIKAGELNNNVTQLLYAAQEEQNQTVITSRIKDGAVTTAKIKDDAITRAKIIDDAVGTQEIANNAIITAKINDAAVTQDKIAPNSVATDKIINSAVTTAKIADTNVTTAKIADSNVTTAKIADTNVTTAKIADSNVTTAKIADLNVTTGKIGNAAVTTDKIADLNVTTGKLGGGSVTTAKIADSAVSTAKVADSAVTTAKILNDNVTAGKLATDSVTTLKILDANVTTAKIADLAVTTAKIANDNVTTGKIGASQVTTAKIADSNVTRAKLEADAVDSTKLADNAVGSEHYQDGSIANDKLVNLTVSGAKIANATISTAKLQDSSVTTAKIAADAIDGTKIADNSINSEHYVDASIDTAHIASAQVTDAKLASNAVTTNKITDANVTTVKIADSNITLAKLASDLKQTTISDSDTQLPTSGAVVDYVAAQIAPLGGLEVIATEVAFPNSQPSSGVVISISDAGGVVVNGSGVSTTGRTVGSSTVTINGFPSSLQSKTMAAGVGLMVSSTGSGQVYNYHKLLAKEADVEQLSNDINDFAARYRVGSSNPTSNNDAGDLFFNTGSSKLLVYNATNSAWEEAQSIGNYFINTISSYSGTGGNSATFNGSAYRFVLSDPGTVAEQHIVSINGVVQKPNSGTSQPSEGFAIDGSSIIFSSAPSSGADFFIITIGSTVNIGTPSNGTVSTDKLASDAVTTAKIADSAVATAKIADSAVATAKIADSAVTSAKIADGAIVNADVNASAAIAGSKISPDFGSQNIVTTGSLSTGEHVTLTGQNPRITFADTNNNPDFQVYGSAGKWNVYDSTNGINRLVVNSDGHVDVAGNLDVGAGVDVTGAITATDHVTLTTDNKRFMAGASNDIRMYHDGTNSYFDSLTGNLYLYNHASAKSIIFGTEGANKWKIMDSGHYIPNADSTFDIGTNTVRVRNIYADTLYGDGSNLTGINTDLVSDTTPQLGGDLSVNNNNIGFGDSTGSNNNRLMIGASNDLQIYHDGNHSRISDQGSGYLVLETSQLQVNNAAGNQTQLIATESGSVSLYHNNSKKLETSSSGVDITGGAVATGNSAQFRAVESGGATVKIQCGGSEGYIGTHTNHKISFVTNAGSAGNGGRRWEISGYGSLIPYDNNTYDIGSSSMRVRNIYTNDLHLSNEGHSNDVDGTWGNWTIQEGESDLFLKNNRSGKKYKFNLTEVS